MSATALLILSGRCMVRLVILLKRMGVLWNIIMMHLVTVFTKRMCIMALQIRLFMYVMHRVLHWLSTGVRRVEAYIGKSSTYMVAVGWVSGNRMFLLVTM